MQFEDAAESEIVTLRCRLIRWRCGREVWVWEGLGLRFQRRSC